MELRRPRVSVAVEELSFTRASARLHLVQSGVSSAIKALERDLGAVQSRLLRMNLQPELGQSFLKVFPQKALARWVSIRPRDRRRSGPRSCPLAPLSRARSSPRSKRSVVQVHVGKQQQAPQAELYGWFTEGFDTAELKDAKALLAQLNA